MGKGENRDPGEERKNGGKEVVSTQIRIPADMHKYIKREAERMGISQIAFLILLLEQGRKLWEADVIRQIEDQ